LETPFVPAPITRTNPGPPPARTLAEVRQYLPPTALKSPLRQPLRILLSAGKKDHGLNEHDYPLWLSRWSRLLRMADNVSVTTCNGFPNREQLAKADVTVFNSNNSGWDLKAASLLDEYQQRGGGTVYLHWGIEGHKHPAELAERIGLAFSKSAYRHGEMSLVFASDPHPIIAGFKEPLRFIDETYWKLHGDAKRLRVLGSSLEENEPRPQLWVKETATARTVGCIPGHYTWTFDDPLYRLLVMRSICWAAKEQDVERLSGLSLIGARVSNTP
jgi:hypothetical protein